MRNHWSSIALVLAVMAWIALGLGLFGDAVAMLDDAIKSGALGRSLGTEVAAAWVSAIGGLIGVAVAATGVWVVPTMARQEGRRNARARAVIVLKSCVGGISQLRDQVSNSAFNLFVRPSPRVNRDLLFYKQSLYAFPLAEADSAQVNAAFEEMMVCLIRAENVLEAYNTQQQIPGFVMQVIFDHFDAILTQARTTADLEV